MKGLLHSKTFKKNLRKWLFMYVGALCILTSVITYSKYMSSFSGNTEAKVAKFNIKVEHVDQCASIQESVCLTGENTRPLEQYEFYFKVDTTELEVKSHVVITTRINESYQDDEVFKINKIVEVTKDLKDIPNSKPAQMEFDVSPEDTGIKYYKVTVDHKITDYDMGGNISPKVLSVGYSAIQID